MNTSEIEILVRSHSTISAPVQQYARAKVEAVLRHTSRPILYARINLDRAGGTAATQASVEIDLNGTILLAKADADSPMEAIDLMKDRLSARLARTDSHRHHRSTLPHHSSTPSTAEQQQL
jgi:ribosome-associated translation inhibitor RaiA